MLAKLLNAGQIKGLACLSELLRGPGASGCLADVDFHLKVSYQPQKEQQVRQLCSATKDGYPGDHEVESSMGDCALWSLRVLVAPEPPVNKTGEEMNFPEDSCHGGLCKQRTPNSVLNLVIHFYLSWLCRLTGLS